MRGIVEVLITGFRCEKVGCWNEGKWFVKIEGKTAKHLCRGHMRIEMRKNAGLSIQEEEVGPRI